MLYPVYTYHIWGKYSLLCFLSCIALFPGVNNCLSVQVCLCVCLGLFVCLFSTFPRPFIAVFHKVRPIREPNRVLPFLFFPFPFPFFLSWNLPSWCLFVPLLQFGLVATQVLTLLSSQNFLSLSSQKFPLPPSCVGSLFFDSSSSFLICSLILIGVAPLVAT